jgi:hypothetical protein
VPFGLGVQHGARHQQLVDHPFMIRLSGSMKFFCALA